MENMCVCYVCTSLENSELGMRNVTTPIKFVSPEFRLIISFNINAGTSAFTSFNLNYFSAV